RDRHRSDASRHRRDRLHLRTHGIKVHVPDRAIAAFQALITDAIDPYVDHDRALIDHVRLDEPRGAHRRDEDLRPSRVRREFMRPAVDDGHRRVRLRAFLHQEAASGFPTMLLRPTITTSLPLGSYPLRVRSSMTPEGVAGANRGRPISTRPTFTGWKQSTSLSGLTAETALSTEIWSGNGCWTRIPWTFGSLFNRPISWRRRASGTSLGSSIVQWAIPISSEAFPFILT